MTREELLAAARKAHVENPWRYGQAVFNVAYFSAGGRVSGNADALRGSAVDPFYDDERVDAFLDLLFLEEEA